MSEHLFLAVTCNTPGCTTGCIVKYLGPYAGQPEIEELAPEWFEYRCAECKRTHRYKRAELYPVVRDHPPPAGFENAF